LPHVPVDGRQIFQRPTDSSWVFWKTFGIEIDKNDVRRILVKHYHPESGSSSPSWLTFLGQMFGVHAGDVDGIALCCIFNRVTGRLPKKPAGRAR